jgi:hypothetical protein
LRFSSATILPALTQRFQRRLPELSVGAGWLGALALTAWLASSWFWRLTAPDPVALVTQPLTDPRAAAQAVAQRHLFGAGTTASGASAPAVRAFTLVGAMTASRRQPGFAVIGETGKPPTAVFEGDEIAPGVKLEQVLANKAIIVRDGQRETIELSAGAPSNAVPPVAVPPAAAGPMANAAAMRPAPPTPVRPVPPAPSLPEMHNP